jgi:hypothetical protein
MKTIPETGPAILTARVQCAKHSEFLNRPADCTIVGIVEGIIVLPHMRARQHLDISSMSHSMKSDPTKRHIVTLCPYSPRISLD